MEKLGWSSELSLGVPAMDAAHKAFVEEMGNLLEMPDEKFSAGLPAFIAATERDFREEEDMMERLNYPGLQSHREQHARVLSALHHVVPDFMKGNYTSARRAIELLPQWFMFHLSTMDTALALATEMDGCVEPAAG